MRWFARHRARLFTAEIQDKQVHTHTKPMCFPDISSKWDTTASVLNHDPALRCQSAHHFFATEIFPGITELSSCKTTAVCVRERERETFSDSSVWASIWITYTMLCGQMTCGNPPGFHSQGKSYISESTHAGRMDSKTKHNSKFWFECLLFYLRLLLIFIPISMAKQNRSFLR